MLRLALALLLLANGAYFAWSHEWLGVLGLAPVRQDEPQRLAQQIRPEGLRLLGAEEARRLQAAPATAAAECLQAGLFDERQAAALREALAPLPAGSWTLEAGSLPGRWIVYMGRYATPEALEKKRAELRALKLRFEPVASAALEPGLSLGEHASEAAADEALAALAERGVRTARVVQERAALRGQWLRLPAADAALRARMEQWRDALAGQPLRPCR